MATEPGSYNQDIQPHRPYEEEIDIREIITILWGGKVLVIGATALAATLSIVIALWLPSVYRAEVLLAPTEQDGNGLSSIAAQYGGLASLAGISIPAGETTQTAVGIAKLESRRFIADFVVRHDILMDLFASKSFDWLTREIEYNTRIFDSGSNTWTRRVRPPLQQKPSLQEAYEEFQQFLEVDVDDETGFVRVSVEHISPVVAAQWVTWLILDLNEEMMLDATIEAQHAIDYLTEQLERTQIVALEEVFYSLIEEQTKTIMLASARPEYLFKTIDPAIVAEEPAKPNRLLIVFLGLFSGLALGVLIVLVRHYFSVLIRD